MKANGETTSSSFADRLEGRSWPFFLPVYATGFFSLSMQLMVQLMIPAWALAMGASPIMIGLAVGASFLLPICFSVSAGALIDQLGSQRVMLWSSLFSIVLAVLYPVFPLFWAFLILQLLNGQAQNMNWIAAQAYAAKLGQEKGGASHINIFSFAVNAGCFVGPLLLGVIWDLFGQQVAFCVVGGWAACLTVATRFLPKEALDRGERDGTPDTWRLLLPRWSVYRRAFALILIPVILLVVYGTFMRLSGYSMRSSFYLVFLEELSFSATSIALLYSFLPLCSVFSPLFIGLFSRWHWMDNYRLLILAVILGILPVSFTPLFAGFWPLLALSGISGIGLGMTLPLLISILSGAVEPKDQGVAAGLRIAINSLASAVVPLMFGLLAQGVGLSTSFYVVGAILLLPMFVIVPLLFARLRRSVGQGVSV